MKFCKIFKNTFFYKTPLEAFSVRVAKRYPKTLTIKHCQKKKLIAHAIKNKKSYFWRWILHRMISVRDFLSKTKPSSYKRYTNADLKICQYLPLHMKIKCWRFHIKTPFTFWDTRSRDMWKVFSQTFRTAAYGEICEKLVKN